MVQLRRRLELRPVDILHPDQPSQHSGGLDPSAAFDRAGNLYYVHLTVTQNPVMKYVSIARSTNGGQTWDLATIAATDFLADKCWITTGPRPGFLTDPTKDIVYAVYAGSGGTHCVRSLDRGANFQNNVVIPGGGSFVSVAADNTNGAIYAVYEKYLSGPPVSNEIRLNYSNDGGLTWQLNDQLVGTTPVNRGEWQTSGFLPSPHGIHPVPSVAVANAGPHAGRVFVSYTSATNPRPDSDITFAWSNDPTTGQSWNPVVAHSTSGISAGKSQFFSWVSTDPMTGVPYVSWLDCRNDPNNKKVERFGTASIDGGQSWLPEIKIADAQSDQSDLSWGFSYGDYIANSAFGGMGFDAWADNSNSTGNNVNGTAALDIYTYRMILSGHVITATGTAGNDIYHVQMDVGGEFVKIWENSSPVGTPTFTMHKDALAGLIFNLDTGTDVIYVAPAVLDYLTASADKFLDAGDSYMIVDYAGASPIMSVQSLLKSGYNDGAWDGNGIRSSTAAAADNTALGYVEATDLFTTFPATFAGQLVDDTSVLVKYTFYGDTDLNGNVNLDDFNRLAANFGMTGKRWFQGDFNYDTIVNLVDFNLLAGNFGSSGLGPGGGGGTYGYTVHDLLYHLMHGGHGLVP